MNKIKVPDGLREQLPAQSRAERQTEKNRRFGERYSTTEVIAKRQPLTDAVYPLEPLPKVEGGGQVTVKKVIEATRGRHCVDVTIHNVGMVRLTKDQGRQLLADLNTVLK